MIIEKTALLVIDMQNLFKESTFNGKVTKNCSKLMTVFHSKNLPIYLTQHNDIDTESSVLCQWWKSPILRESYEWQLMPEIKDLLNSNDVLVQDKTTYDAFIGTNLQQSLNKNKIENLIICGCMTNLCCETTARSAFCRNFNICFPEDANGTLTREMHIRSIENLRYGFAKIYTTDQLINIIEN
ncbi:MAG: isochorismatase family protein [bacterium]|nr:isochorismatase family protein [bacterium]